MAESSLARIKMPDSPKKIFVCFPLAKAFLRAVAALPRALSVNGYPMP
jgi:hypothetical protein